MVSISIALSVAVLNLNFRGHNLYKLPNWIKIFLIMEKNYHQENYAVESTKCDFVNSYNIIIFFLNMRYLIDFKVKTFANMLIL